MAIKTITTVITTTAEDGTETTQTITTYQTTDGKIFDSKPLAEAHQAEIDKKAKDEANKASMLNQMATLEDQLLALYCSFEETYGSFTQRSNNMKEALKFTCKKHIYY